MTDQQKDPLDNATFGDWFAVLGEHLTDITSVLLEINNALSGGLKVFHQIPKPDFSYLETIKRETKEMDTPAPGDSVDVKRALEAKKRKGKICPFTSQTVVSACREDCMAYWYDVISGITRCRAMWGKVEQWEAKD